MTSPPLPNFKVFIVESPSADDFLSGRSEGQALSAALDLSEVPNRRFNIISKATLVRCFEMISSELGNSIVAMATQGTPAILTWLHFSCHGNESGLALANEEFLAWDDLKSELVKFFPTGQLVISLSSCDGAAASAAMFAEPPPYGCALLIGPDRDVAWADALTAFVAFYHLTLKKGKRADEAVDAMNAAAGLNCVFRVTHRILPPRI